MSLGFGDLLSRSHRTAVQIHLAAVWGRLRKHHTTAAPVAGGMRPGARRRIAYTQLLCQGQGNAPLLQIGIATTARQSGLERGELLG